jgi:hypothetical protein
MRRSEERTADDRLPYNIALVHPDGKPKNHGDEKSGESKPPRKLPVEPTKP